MMPVLPRWLNSESAVLAHFKSSGDTRLTYRVPEIEIGYTIVEDDMTVRLEDVVVMG